MSKKGWYHWSLKERNLFIKLIKDDYNYREISKKLNRTCNAIRTFNYRHLKLKTMKHGNIQNVNLRKNKVLVYILGVLFGDGSIFKIKNTNSYTISLMVHRKEFALAFKHALKQLGLRVSLQQVNHGLRNKKQYFVRATSRILGEFITNLSKSSGKKLFEEKSNKIAFLKGFFESEGNHIVRKDRGGESEVVFSNTSLKLMWLVQELIKNLGYESSLTILENRKQSFGKRPLLRLYLLGTSETKRQFLREINPIIKGVCHS